MELKGSKTEKNLWEAFAGESQARNKYTYFASKAKKEGYEQIGHLHRDRQQREGARQDLVQAPDGKRRDPRHPDLPEDGRPGRKRGAHLHVSPHGRRGQGGGL